MHHVLFCFVLVYSQGLGAFTPRGVRVLRLSHPSCRRLPEDLGAARRRQRHCRRIPRPRSRLQGEEAFFFAAGAEVAAPKCVTFPMVMVSRTLLLPLRGLLLLSLPLRNAAQFFGAE